MPQPAQIASFTIDMVGSVSILSLDNKPQTFTAAALA